MKKRGTISAEFMFQVLTLVVAVIIVQAFYATIVRPRARAALEAERVAMADDPDHVSTRSFYVVIRDYEQEICFILMLWAFAIMAYKGLAIVRARRMLQKDIVPLAEGMRILPEDARSLQHQINALPPRAA